MTDLVQHWNQAFDKPIESLGWYESDPQPTWDLVQTYTEPEHRIHIAGAGRSVLVSTLWEEGYQNLLLSDLSDQALKLLSKDNPSIPKDYFWQSDLSQAWGKEHSHKIDTWIDRAVLHFLTQEEQRQVYFKNLKSALKPGGRVILGQFAIEGAKKCCGLDIFPYDTERYCSYLGSEFDLLEDFDFTYYNPNGDPRPYAYAVFEKS